MRSSLSAIHNTVGALHLLHKCNMYCHSFVNHSDILFCRLVAKLCPKHTTMAPGLILLFWVLKMRGFSEKELIYFVFVLSNGPPVLAVCKTLQKLKNQLYNRKYQNSIYLPLTQGMNGMAAKKTFLRRLTKCFSNSPHKWAMRRRRHKIEKTSQFERKYLFLEFQRK